MVSSSSVLSRPLTRLLAVGAVLLAGAAATAPAQAAPLAPAALTSPANDPAGVTPVDAPQFTWAPVAGAAAYELQLSDDDAFQQPVTVTVPVPRWAPTTTLPQDQYFWRVRALQADGTPSPWTASSAFRREWLAPAPAGDPDGAGNLAARPLLSLKDADAGTAGVQLPADQLTFSWSPVRGASYYVIDISSDPGFAPSSGSETRKTCRTAHTTFTPYGGATYAGTARKLFDPCNIASPDTPFLATGGTYFVRVRAVDETPDEAVITSLWSNAARPGPAASSATPASFTIVAPTRPTSPADQAAVVDDPFPAAPFADVPLLSWRPVTGAKAYLVGLAKDSSFNTSLLVPDNDLRTDSYWVTTNTELITNQTLLDSTVTSGYHWFALPCSAYKTPGDKDNRCVGSAQAINTAGRFGSFTKRARLVTGLNRTVDAANLVSFAWDDQGLVAQDAGSVTVYELEVRNAKGEVVDDVKTDNAFYWPASGTYPDGAYSWRVRVIDASGTAQAWTTGESFSTKAPVPPPPAVGTPGGPGAPAGTAVLTTANLKGTQAIASGRSADIAGVLLTKTDAPVAGVAVEVQAQPAGSTQWVRVARLTTTSTGAFATVVTPKRNTRYRAVFAGTPAAAPDTSPTIRVSVVPTLTLKASARRVDRGGTLTFSGRLTPKDAAGKVALQCRRAKKFVTVSSAKVAPDGAYRLRLKVTSAGGTRCRAAIAATDEFAGARSREAAFAVR